MKTKVYSLLVLLLFLRSYDAEAQEKVTGNIIPILSESGFKYLSDLARDVIDSSRIQPGQMIAGRYGPNNTGGILIRPGGRDCYPSFWIRDYAMSLESGFINTDEQKHMLLLTASTQCDQSWITKGGSMVPVGAIADHIRIDDGLPVYFPGTLDYTDQGNKTFGMFPPYDDQFFFIHMAYCYVSATSDNRILRLKVNGLSLFDRLEAAFKVPPSRADNNIVFTTDEFRGVDFGFRDVIGITGDLCMTSILKCRAADELAGLAGLMGNKELAGKYGTIARKIKEAIPRLFLDKRGMLHASTGKSGQADVWSTGLAVYFDILEGADRAKVCRFLSDSYSKGYLSCNGNIRHVLTIDDYSTTSAWEISLAKKDTYQNGAYWGTATGWICYAIALDNPGLAMKLANEYIEDLRKNDFRQGGDFGAPYECFHPSGHRQNPVYMTTVTCPLIVFKSMLQNSFK